MGQFLLRLEGLPDELREDYASLVAGHPRHSALNPDALYVHRDLIACLSPVFRSKLPLHLEYGLTRIEAGCCPALAVALEAFSKHCIAVDTAVHAYGVEEPPNCVQLSPLPWPELRSRIAALAQEVSQYLVKEPVASLGCTLYMP